MRELLASSQLSQVWIRQCSSGLPVRHRFSEVAKVPTSLRGGTPVVNPNLSDRVVYDAARRVSAEAKRKIVIVDERYSFIKSQGFRDFRPHEQGLNGHAGLRGQQTFGDPAFEWAPRAAPWLGYELAGLIDQFIWSVTPWCRGAGEAVELEDQFARSPTIIGIQKRDPLAPSLVEPDVSDSRDVAATDLPQVPQARLGETAYPAVGRVRRSVVYDNQFPVRHCLRLDGRDRGRQELQPIERRQHD